MSDITQESSETATSLLDFPQSESDRMFDELAQLSVELDDDPLVFGPKRLNSKTSQVRRMLDRCEKLYLEVSRRLQFTRRALRVAETQLDLEKKYLYTNDPETRAGRSVSDREAIASGKLRKEVQLANDLNIAVADLEAVLTVIKSKRSDLKDTEGRLRDQMRLCAEEINLGSRWGSQVAHAPDIKGKSAREYATGDDVLDINSILQGVDGEIALSRGTGTWDDPETETEAVQEETLDTPFVAPEIQATFLRPKTPVVVASPVEETVLLVEAEIPVEVEQPVRADVEPVGDLLDTGADVIKALPSTTTENQVDTFLDEVVMDTTLKAKRPDVNKAVDDELDLDSILSSFEGF